MVSDTPRPVPTQVLHSWRAVARTVFAFVVAVSLSWGAIVDALHLDPSWQWVAVAGLITGAITKLLANPMVEATLQQYAPWLAATPKQ